MIFKTLTALVTAAFLFVIANIGLETPLGLTIKKTIGTIPLADKSLHFLLLAVLSFLVNASMRRRRVNLLGVNLLLGSLLVALGITLEEISQAFIPSRHFELMDMVCNYAGIYSGSFLLCLQKHQHSTYGGQNNRETFSLQTIFHRTRPLHDESGHGRSAPGSLGGHQSG